MKLMIIRHGDPDFSINSLTEKGWREAEYLAQWMEGVEAKAYYVSPMGRAVDTANCTLKKIGREGQILDWLREFEVPVYKPNHPGQSGIPWDWLPGDWTEEERFFHYDQWHEPEVFAESDVKKEYDWVISNFDALLKENGYEREGKYYRAVRPNNDTLVFFCHFGLECILLSHLLNMSPMTLWHGTCAAPSSITTVATEERREGIAYFRMLSFGDISHLNLHGEPRAFAARFRECHFNEHERRD